ncbi:MAG: D-aminoacylase [Candidatus Sumerlaeaceae bacterium]|nr:D-aminoacylase [Candidatus Sumerlaeaceae bacterium]
MDLLIKNGTIIDGTGTPGYRADIAIKGDRISEIVRLDQQPEGIPPNGIKTIDATDRIVTPGFVDVHSHSDFNILINPNGESKLRQGITTEVVGNCGFSAFPLRGIPYEEEGETYAKLGFKVDWSSASEYFKKLEAAKPAFNLATYVGHGNVRGCVMGHDDRPPTEDELRAMVREVEEAVDSGAIGLSTGLIYSPGIFAETPEIVALQNAATKRGGIYTSHVRGEGDTLLEAADEFFDVINGSNCQGQFSHLKASGPKNWGKVKRVIEQIEEINDKGGNVRFDKYPYIASSTELASLLPRWARNGGREKSLERLNDTKLRKQLIAESAEINEGKDGWNSVLICEAGAPEYEKFQGKSVGDIARILGADAGEMFAELLTKSHLTTSICNFTMSQDDTDLAILHPLGMVCSDAACRAPYGALSHDCPHPRAYGTFAKFFRDYVKERPLLTLEKAVAKVTALPCETFGFKNRGRIAKDYFADVLVINFADYEDKSQFADPHHYCTGIDAIIVNGTLTVHDGGQTGQRNGRVLRLND